MKSYEAVCIFHPETKMERIDNLLKKLEDKIKAGGGEVEGIKKWGMKRLSYTFGKQKKIKDGFYVLLKFKGEGNVPQELGKQLKVIEDIIRYMITIPALEAMAAETGSGEGGKVEIEPSMLIKDETKAKE